jgi:predicted Zn-dependent peptidase
VKRIKSHTLSKVFIPDIEKTVPVTYKKTVLPNGIRVVSEFLPHVRSVSLGIWIDVGSRYENLQDNGITHFIEHMVFKGTKKRDTRAIAQSLEMVGGYLNAFTGKEHTCFYARVLDEHVDLAMDVLSDMILHPTFLPKEIRKEKNVIIEELKQTEDDPDDVIHDYFEKELFGSHTLAMPVIGTEKNIRSFNQKSLLNFLQTHYAADRIVVAAAGNVTHEQAVDLSRHYFGALQSPGISEKTDPSVIVLPAHGRFEYARPIKQSHICMGTIGYDIRDKRRFPLQVLSTLMGDGMSSRLFQNIRERYGFAYSVYSFNNHLSDTGSFGAYIGTDDTHVDRCIDLVWKEFKNARSIPLKKKEIDSAKAQLKGSIMLGLESTSNRMIRLGSSELYFGELTPQDAVLKLIDGVTLEQVEEVAQDLFHDSRFITVIFRPEERGKSFFKKVRKEKQ